MALRRVLRLLFWGAAIFAFVMAILPKPPHLPTDPPDKIQHIIAFLTLAGLAGAAYPRASLVRIGVALSAFGAVIEIVQAVPMLHRDSELLDWAADTAAAALMLLLWALVRARRTKMREWRE
jgi:VanZ family protein